ncbi:hypothetical protein NQZ68_003700 [Dissostichus eleginoides]|nr:hypothetical protein NQZ68_003700 [Dissostichus eleginoides]
MASLGCIFFTGPQPAWASLCLPASWQPVRPISVRQKQTHNPQVYTALSGLSQLTELGSLEQADGGVWVKHDCVLGREVKMKATEERFGRQHQV